jgi:methylase of polypeptide subunit release factors
VSDGHHTWGEAAERYQNALPREQRKRDGVWFTPFELALATARRTLLPLLEHEASTDPLRICDPAVGGGSFLLAASTALREGKPIAAEFTGIDLEATAVQLAESALRERQEPRLRMLVGDGLTELEPGSFDCVLANPPWETLQSGAHRKDRIHELRQRFQHQGQGKLYTYRLFVERAVQLLRPGGRLGMIVPASLWFDRDAQPLRRLLLDTCDWQWLFGFENRERIFAIDSRYRFGAIIATKGGRTEQVKVAFGRGEIAEWATDKPAHVVYQREELQQLSPHAGTFVEVESRRDLDILTRMQHCSRALLGDGGSFVWRQGDFNMTSDRQLFVLREQAEADGYAHDGLGVWRCTGRDDLLALRQGAMLYDLQSNAGAHQTGTGHKTRWRRPAAAHELRPLYLIPRHAWRERHPEPSPARIALRALSNATNERTAIACMLPDVPCGNSLGVLLPADACPRPTLRVAAGTAMLASLPFDWSLRLRLAGTNLNRFVLTDCRLPQLDQATTELLARLALRMCATTPWTDELWQLAEAEGWCHGRNPATDPAERRQLTTTIDATVSRAFFLTPDDVAWMTRGRPFLKGFWRIERELPERERRPNRWLRALTANAKAPDVDY